MQQSESHMMTPGPYPGGDITSLPVPSHQNNCSFNPVTAGPDYIPVYIYLLAQCTGTTVHTRY